MMQKLWTIFLRNNHISVIELKLSARRLSSNISSTKADYSNLLKACTSLKSPQKLGFTWITEDETLLWIMQQYFSSFSDIFCINDNPIAETRGICVDIIPVTQTNFNCRTYLDQTPHESVAIGGPSALVMAYFEAERYAKKSSMLLPPIFATRSITDSNAFGSALQIHQRYAQRMAYTDSKYEGWHLLKTAMERLLLSGKIEEAQIADYLTVDFDWDSIWRNDPLAIASICIRNEYVTWCDKFKRWRNAETTGSKTYHYAKESTKILQSIDADLGSIFTQQGAISIGLSRKEYEAIQRKNTWLLNRYCIDSMPISPSALKNQYGIFPTFSDGGGAFYYPSDGFLHYDFWKKLEQGIIKNKGIVDTCSLKKIILSQDESKVIGVVVEQKGTERFIRTDHVYTSLGYNTQYQFKVSKKNKFHYFLNPSVEKITTATGFSGVALIFGDTPKVPVAFNSHHTTPMAKAYDSHYGWISLVKTTGGALIGSNAQYHVQHAANNLWYNERIFGHEKFKLFAAKGCSRSINSENSGKFTQLPGLVIGTGRGGKGVTDMCADAVVAGQLLRDSEPPYRAHSIHIPSIREAAKIPYYSLFSKDLSKINSLEQCMNPFIKK